MRLVTTRAEVRAWSSTLRSAGQRSALVPTMGYLHEGHLSLAEIGRGRADLVALSIFVNPLQFGPSEDFESYPRDLERDLALAESAGADLVFAPVVAEMYPAGEPRVAVIPQRGADVLCGASRPGHFGGVLTVVSKLFGIFTPDVAVFGQKDFQQLTLIRNMTVDLDMPVEIVSAPIRREPDGLAMSSRNRYLSAEERTRALALVRALRECEDLFTAGVSDAAEYRLRMHKAEGVGVSIEYGEVVHPETLEPLRSITSGSLCAIAARVGRTRLIDNHLLGSGAP
jgi:pantoate--beta-alanine ligase